MFEKVKRMVRHNQAQAIAIVIIAAASFWMFGCEAKVKSLADASVKVTRAELVIEKDGIVASIAAKIGLLEVEARATAGGYELRVANLDRLDALKAQVAKVGMIVAEGGVLNPAGLAAVFMALYGISAVADNRKKDGIIIDIKKNVS